jgi:hypothetical protein
MRSRDSLGHVLGSSVRIRGVRVGHVTGVVFDATETSALGVEVTSPDSARRFLPWAAGCVADGVLDADSALLLVDPPDSPLERGGVLCRDPEYLSTLAAVDGGRLTAVSAPEADAVHSH